MSDDSTPQTTMLACVLNTHGATPVVTTRPAPQPQSGRTLIEVACAPITPLDVMCASGTSRFGPPPVPYVPGVQGVGRVIDSALFDVGALVWFQASAGMAPGDGAFRELTSIPDESVFLVPNGVPADSVAALGLSAIAALMALTWTGELQEGESVLVLGGGGPVGQSAIQIAQARRAARIVALCRSDQSVEASRAFGAVPVQLKDGESRASLTARLSEAAGAPVDLVLDTLWGEPAAAALGTMARFGRLVNLGSTAAESATFTSEVLRGGAYQVRGYSNGDLSREQMAAALDEISRLVVDGRLGVAANRVALADFASAWTKTEAKFHAERQVVVFEPSI